MKNDITELTKFSESQNPMPKKQSHIANENAKTARDINEFSLEYQAGLNNIILQGDHFDA
jgi:hypothetical protein